MEHIVAAEASLGTLEPFGPLVEQALVWAGAGALVGRRVDFLYEKEHFLTKS